MSYTITIDPGHGSLEYPGALYPPYVEKDMSLAVSLVIKDRLEQYDDVKVILTRNTDAYVGLKERCDIAKNSNSDLFISIHFNCSADHESYGSEVYLPIQSQYYNYAYPVAYEFMNNFDSMGLLNRGIKTKADKNGNNNYYAVLKYSSNYKIPSLIIEHCHIDNIHDISLLPTNSTAQYNLALTNLGLQDADAIARGLHLKSTSLGIDYTNYKTANSNKSGLIKQDYTEPEINKVELLSQNDTTVTLKLTAKDTNGSLLYYKYSLDGGLTYSERIPWPKNKDNTPLNSFTTTININSNSVNNIITCVYNQYDLFTLSNTLTITNQYTMVKETDLYNIENTMNVLYSPVLLGLIAFLGINKLFKR